MQLLKNARCEITINIMGSSFLEGVSKIIVNQKTLITVSVDINI